MNIVTLYVRSVISQDERYCRALADAFARHLPDFLSDVAGWALHDGDLSHSYRPALDTKEALVAFLLQESIEKGGAR